MSVEETIAPRLIEFLRVRDEKKREEAEKVLGGVRLYVHDARTLVLRGENGREVAIRVEGLNDIYTLLGAFTKLFNGDVERAEKASGLVALYIDLGAVEERLLAPKGGGGPAEGEGQGLSDSKLIELKELLKEAFSLGYGQDLTLYLSEWLARAGVSPASAMRLVRVLHEEGGDLGLLKLRLAAVVHGYRRAGWDLEKHAKEIEAEARASLGELEGIPINTSPKWSGVGEILEKVLGAERAKYVVLRVEEILGAASPFRDYIFEELDREQRLYAVADLRESIVARAKRGQDWLRYKEIVVVGIPTHVEVYIDPVGGTTKFLVVWEDPVGPRPVKIGPALVEEIVEKLVAEGLVLSRRLAPDIVTAIIRGYVRRGRALVKTEAESPGFYMINGRVAAVKVETNRPGREELGEALELLDDLAKRWFGHVVDRFSLAVKWGLIAPFGYVYKLKGRWIPWLYIYGSSHTGKTTLGEIVLAMWGLGPENKKSGANIDTPARLGHILSQSTFPVLVNEPGGALFREDVVEMIKSAVESTVARGRYMRRSYMEVPALATLVFTSNRTLPKDDALLRRFLIIRFTFGEKISKEKAEEFEKMVRPRLVKLSVLGRYVANVVLGEPGVLDQGWEKAAETLLERAYREAGLEPPDWIYKRPQLEGDFYEDVRESIRNFLVERINEAYFRAAGRVEVVKEEGISYRSRLELGLTERARVVFAAGLIPWASLKRGDNDEELAVFTTGLARELEAVIGDIGGLKSIAELLGWEYKTVKIGTEAKKVAVVRFSELIEFLGQ